ncbi:MAG: hypothetical protein LAT75_10460 [Candidatus Cyclonatronum sp.]|uniref:hypothetical protein n=1 Tax=Cyclonatronum sp. TaxID=3024185 RepID=UPI0025BA340B|nr:hypothetical protein [Cyclonatronum sp.]MCH8487280.1 hypothetical protein [Cyclonatronum sp.]
MTPNTTDTKEQHEKPYQPNDDELELLYHEHHAFKAEAERFRHYLQYLYLKSAESLAKDTEPRNPEFNRGIMAACLEAYLHSTGKELFSPTPYGEDGIPF